MQPPESYRLFIRRIGRGGIILKILSLLLMGVGALALITPGMRVWAIVAWFGGVACLLGIHYVRNRYISALNVSENPQLVYWGQPSANGTAVTLHLRDGKQLEIELPESGMRDLVSWLKERNPSLRWGAYDASGTQHQA